METIGNDVTLPCVAVGNPVPQVYWVSAQDNLVTSTSADERIKVSVKWSKVSQDFKPELRSLTKYLSSPLLCFNKFSTQNNQSIGPFLV